MDIPKDIDYLEELIKKLSVQIPLPMTQFTHKCNPFDLAQAIVNSGFTRIQEKGE